MPELTDELAELPDSTVMCSHGDLIPEVIEGLLRRGADLTTAPDWRKAVTWVLERDGDHIVRMSTVEPPPSNGD